MTGVQKRILQRSADIFGSFTGHTVNDFSREKSNLEGSLALPLPVVVLGLAVYHNDRIAD